MNRTFRQWLALAICLIAGGCVTTSNAPDINPGERPALDTAEGGLWMMMDKAESNLKTSGKLVGDPQINAYVNEIVCRLARDYCNDIRVYVVRSPNFNASMAPNGSMHVWTGMLLRARNEDQLAFVLGHEIAHYLRRHSLQRWQALRNSSDFLMFFKVAAMFAGVGVAGDVATLIAAGSLAGYSRDQEREADAYGLKLMAEAGYDPREAAKIWTALLAEKDAEGEESKSLFFASHPTSSERAETMAKAAQPLLGRAQEHGVTGEAFQRAVSRYRDQWLRDELRQKRFKSFRVLLEQQHKHFGEMPLFDFYRGELHRLRANKGDDEEALAFLQKAVECPEVPVAAYRSLGLVHWNLNQLDDARSAFEKYLSVNPEANDHKMIKSYVRKLSEKKK